MNYNAMNDINKLKANLQRVITQELEQFKTATGLTPAGLDVQFIDVTTSGERTNSYVVGNVHVRFEA